MDEAQRRRPGCTPSRFSREVQRGGAFAFILLVLACLPGPAAAASAPGKPHEDGEPYVRRGLVYAQGALGLSALEIRERNGVGLPLTLRLGIAPLPGFAFGAGGLVLPGSDLIADLTVSAVEGFVTFYVSPRSGFHFEASAGYARIDSDAYGGVCYVERDPAAGGFCEQPVPTGLILGGGIGREWHIGSNVSLGPLLRFNYAHLTSDPNVDVGFYAFSVLAGITYY